MSIDTVAPLFTNQAVRRNFLALPIERQSQLQREVLNEIVLDPRFQKMAKENPLGAGKFMRDIMRKLPLPPNIILPDDEALQSPAENASFIEALTSPGILLEPDALVGAFAGANFAKGAAALGAQKVGRVAAQKVGKAVEEAAPPPTTVKETIQDVMESPPPPPKVPPLTEERVIAEPIATPVTQADLGTSFFGEVELGIPRLNLDVAKKINDMAQDMFQSGALEFRHDTRIMFQIVDGLADGSIGNQQFTNLLAKHRLSKEEFASFYSQSGTFSARFLADLSVRKRALQKMMGKDSALDKELGEAIQQIDEELAVGSVWRQLDNIRRGLLVSQLATATRNLETQMARIGLEVLGAGMDQGIRKVMGLPSTGKSALSGLEQVLQIFRRGTKADVEGILALVPTQRKRLLFRYSSDVSSRAADAGLPLSATNKALAKANQVVNVINFFNRGQEFLTRRGVFHAMLNQKLKEKGSSFEAFKKKVDDLRASGVDQKDLVNQTGIMSEEEFTEAVRESVTQALKVTFAEDPQFGTLGQKFISFINAFPGATFAIPFPRFMVNSLKFHAEFSPLGFLKLLRPSERAKLAEGDPAVLSKALIGSAMLGTALQIRDSEFAGERWWELKNPETGELIDTRPFNPFAAYLFAAEVYRKKRDGTLDSLQAKDIIMGVLSSNLRAGAGLYLLDQTLEGIVGQGDTERAVEHIKRFAGSVASGFATPLQQLNDLFAEFDQGLRVMKETQEEFPFAGPTLRRVGAIPGFRGLMERLPEVEIPTREAPPERIDPLLRQLTGLAKRQPRNPVESELERFGFTRNEILPRTDDRKFDRLTAREMGPMVEQMLIPLVETEAWENTEDRLRAVILKFSLRAIRGEAKRVARAALTSEEQADKQRRDALKRLDKRLRLFLKDKGIE